MIAVAASGLAVGALLAIKLDGPRDMFARAVLGAVLALASVPVVAFALASVGLRFEPLFLCAGLAVLAVAAWLVPAAPHTTAPAQQVRIVAVGVAVMWAAAIAIGSGSAGLPASRSLDAPSHYALAQYVAEARRPPGDDFSYLSTYRKYPYGFHLDAAVIADTVSQPVIHVLFPLALLIEVLTAAVVVGIAARLARGGTGIVASAILLVLSYHFTDAVASQAFWPQALGGLLVLAFAWILERRDEGGARSLALAVLAVGTVAVYPVWFTIPIALLALDAYRGRTRWAEVIGVAGIAVVAALLFIHDRIAEALLTVNVEGGVVRDPLALALVTAPAFILGALGVRTLQRIPIAAGIVALALLHAAVLITMKRTIGLGSDYSAVKYLYLAVPVLCALAAAVWGRARGTVVAGAIAAQLALAVMLHPLVTPSITADAYEALIWARANVRQATLAYVGTPSDALWGYAITGRPLTRGDGEWWLRPPPAFDAWAAAADSGEVAVVLSGGTPADGRSERLYERAGIVIVRRR